MCTVRMLTEDGSLNVSVKGNFPRESVITLVVDNLFKERGRFVLFLTLFVRSVIVISIFRDLKIINRM